MVLKSVHENQIFYSEQKKKKKSEKSREPETVRYGRGGGKRQNKRNQKFERLEKRDEVKVNGHEEKKPKRHKKPA